MPRTARLDAAGVLYLVGGDVGAESSQVLDQISIAAVFLSMILIPTVKNLLLPTASRVHLSLDTQYGNPLCSRTPEASSYGIHVTIP
jgi:hypothetical protein